MFSLVYELIIFKPVNYDVNYLGRLLFLYLLESALEKMVDHCHFMRVLGLLKKLHCQNLWVVLAKSLNYLDFLQSYIVLHLKNSVEKGFAKVRLLVFFKELRVQLLNNFLLGQYVG